MYAEKLNMLKNIFNEDKKHVDRTKGGAQKSGIWQTDKQTRQDRQVGWPGGVGTKHTDTLIQSQTDRQIEG